MINSHLLYQLSYRGTTCFLSQKQGPVVKSFPVSEARHSTVSRAPVKPLNCFYYNALQLRAGLGDGKN
jgi:hypothetical protein